MVFTGDGIELWWWETGKGKKEWKVEKTRIGAIFYEKEFGEREIKWPFSLRSSFGMLKPLTVWMYRNLFPKRAGSFTSKPLSEHMLHYVLPKLSQIYLFQVC